MDEIFKAIIYLKDFYHSYDNCLQCPIFIPEKEFVNFLIKSHAIGAVATLSLGD